MNSYPAYPIPPEVQTFSKIALVAFAVVLGAILWRREPALTLDESKEMLGAASTIAVVLIGTLAAMHLPFAGVPMAVGLGALVGVGYSCIDLVDQNHKQTVFGWSLVMVSGAIIPGLADALAFRISMWIAIIFNLISISMILWHGHAIDQESVNRSSELR